MAENTRIAGPELLQRVVSGRRELGGAAGFTLVSQLSASLTNLLGILLVSRSNDASAIGAMAFALVMYQFLVGAFRTLFGEVVLVLGGQVDDRLRHAFGKCLVVCGGLTSVVVVAVSAALSSELMPITIVATCLLPLLLQDSLRYLAFAESRPAIAARGDAIWVAILVVSLVVVEAKDFWLTGSGWAAVWCAGGIVAVPAMMPTRLRGSRALAPAQAWLRIAVPLARSYFPEFLVNCLTTLAPVLLLAPLYGLAPVGELRLTAAFFGPVTIAWVSTMNVFIPVRVRAPKQSIRAEVAISAGFVLLTALWSLLGTVMPRTLAERFFGPTWDDAADWLPWLGASYIALAASCGAIIGLRVRNLAHLSLRARMLGAPVAIAGTLYGFGVAGPAGYGLALFLACSLTSLLTWSALLRMQAETPSGGR